MLKKRIITALILIPLFLFALFFMNPAEFCIFTGLVVLAAAWEWTKLMGLKNLVPRFLYLTFLLAIAYVMLFFPVPIILMLASVWWLVALGLIIAFPKGKTFFSKAILLRGVMGLFVLIPCWASINYIRNLGNGEFTLLFLFLLVWGADTAAYFVGKKWGKTKLASKVSPGKSIQGFIGALVCGLVLAVIASIAGHIPSFMWPWVIGVSLVTVVFSVVGDLFESVIKRIAGVKDSGKMLPGHGGLLDRIDSLTAAAPIYGLGLFLMMMVAYH